MKAKFVQTFYGLEIERINTWDLYLGDGSLNTNYMKGRYVYNPKAEGSKHGYIKATYKGSDKEDKNKTPKYYGIKSDGKPFHWKITTSYLLPEGWKPVSVNKRKKK